MGLLGTIVGIAGLFLRLNAEFLAAMQLLVYAGAIVVLFVFVIMLLGPSATSKGGGGSRVSRALAGVLMAVLGIFAFALFVSGDFHDFQTIEPTHGTVEAVGGLIFSRGLVPFEIATVLLIVAVVGAISVARTKPTGGKPSTEPNPTLRMFHGPLLPRDAERPLTGEPLKARVSAESNVSAEASKESS
jgi:NADH-quinone oxidoreductase subunit J